MEEDATIARERENLKRELAKLESALVSINALESEAHHASIGDDEHILNSGYDYLDDAEDEDMGMA